MARPGPRLDLFVDTVVGVIGRDFCAAYDVRIEPGVDGFSVIVVYDESPYTSSAEEIEGYVMRQIEDHWPAGVFRVDVLARPTGPAGDAREAVWRLS